MPRAAGWARELGTAKLCSQAFTTWHSPAAIPTVKARTRCHTPITPETQCPQVCAEGTGHGVEGWKSPGSHLKGLLAAGAAAPWPVVNPLLTVRMPCQSVGSSPNCPAFGPASYCVPGRWPKSALVRGPVTHVQAGMECWLLAQPGPEPAVVVIVG